eukprot:m.112155 g.112155  ORF g.112155 m.112155 type:complete len:159 (-) comp9389_c0_seq4:168-644(-)
MLLMEAILLSIVEGFKDPMLSTTFSMIILGMLFLFAGFFKPIPDMPVSVAWMSVIIPSRYALEGALVNTFKGQTYSGLDGGDLVYEIFDLDPHLDKWAWFFIVIGWVLFYRVVHYAMVSFTNRKYGKSNTKSSGSSASSGTNTTENGMQLRNVAVASV